MMFLLLSIIVIEPMRAGPELFLPERDVVHCRRGRPRACAIARDVKALNADDARDAAAPTLGAWLIKPLNTPMPPLGAAAPLLSTLGPTAAAAASARRQSTQQPAAVEEVFLSLHMSEPGRSPRRPRMHLIRLDDGLLLRRDVPTCFNSWHEHAALRLSSHPAWQTRIHSPLDDRSLAPPPPTHAAPRACEQAGAAIRRADHATPRRWMEGWLFRPLVVHDEKHESIGLFSGHKLDQQRQPYGIARARVEGGAPYRHESGQPRYACDEYDDRSTHPLGSAVAPAVADCTRLPLSSLFGSPLYQRVPGHVFFLPRD